MTINRLNRLIELIQAAKLDTVVLNPGSTLTYLTGMSFHLMERPVVLFVSPAAPAAMVLPELEMRKLDNSPFPLQGFPYGDNPATWAGAFRQAAQFAGLDGKAVGVEPARLRVLELRFLEDAAPGARFVSAETPINGLRIRKDEQEIAAMRKAVQIAQQALKATLPSIRPGVTEREIAAELSIQLLRAGSDSDLSFAPIVSGGPNGANPHATPSDRKLERGDLLVIDWGASYHGYTSDLTRTFAIGEIEPEFRRIYEVVKEANAAGRAAGRPEVAAGWVDRAARSVIEQAGYGHYFTHRTGHGLGMEGHEPPYMFGENPLPLEEGMTYTVEPGIYLPGRGGVRIEDDVVVTVDGSETLSDFERELITLE